MTEQLEEQLKQLPPNPGVYRFYNIDQELIYVGKAKNLKNRVSSYFVKSNQHSSKTLRLVHQIDNLKYTVVNSEYDALLLENSFIKKYQPRYNILLKDDKSYPYIKIVNEPFPRIISTRRLEKGTGEYFGPFSNVSAVNTLIELIHKLYNIRTCSLNLTTPNIESNKFEVCLEHHIGNCQAPCVAKQAEEQYMFNIAQAKSILKGNLSVPKNHYKNLMQELSSNFEFEKAHEVKIKYDLLESFEEKSVVSNPKLEDVDVVTLMTEKSNCYINYFKVQYGIITASKNLKVTKSLDEPDTEILLTLISIIREDIKSKASEVYTNLDISQKYDDYLVSCPKIGDKRKLVELSIKNALIEKKQRLSSESKKLPPKERILIQAKKDLRLTDIPRHIECFDNSNIQGTNPVASMVCFKNGVPAKKDYRHFKIKTVEGPNDFDSMYEIVYRRYKRLKEEQIELPNLVLIDGGKGQLSAALKAVKELNLEKELPLVGIAKRLEELYYPGDEFPLFLSKKSETLKLLQQLRNEAHRFAITFHRKKRSDHFLDTELSKIDGIGPKTIQALLSHFKSVENIKKAPVHELVSQVGKVKAREIKNYFSDKSGT